MTASSASASDQGASLDDMLPEAFAVCREAGQRVLAMRHFDVQLHRRHGAAPRRHRRDEDRRGQDARRDAARLPERARAARASTSSPSTTTSPAATPSGWAASTSSSACRSASSCTASSDAERQRSYRCDITYGTNNEFGFDYLRDNMKDSIERYVQRDLQLRDRRRGRLDPDRRGAHAAHHLGLGRAVGRPLPEGQRHHPGPAQGHRLHRRREGALGDPDRPRRRTRRAAAERRQPVRPDQHRVAAPRRRRRCARTRCTSATSTTWSTRARSSSSTSSPAGRCRAGAGRTACTRRSRPRRASRFRKRTRRWPPSASRTTSASTRSWRA